MVSLRLVVLAAPCSAAAVLLSGSVWVGAGTWPNITPLAYGGAIHIRYPALVMMVNNIFCGNLAESGHSVASTQNGNGSVSHCDTWPQTGNDYYADPFDSTLTLSNLIYVDPEFCYVDSQSNDPGSFRLWLSPQSELRTVTAYKGQNPAQNPIVPTEDIDGRPRPGDDYTDMGAYENDELKCP